MPKETGTTQPVRIHNNSGYKIAAVAIALILLFGVFVAGALAGRFSGQRGFAGSEFLRSDTKSLMMGREFGSRNLLSSTDRITGVVTAVNGSSFTVAGHGATNTVSTDSSTQYQGGDSVKVNDSVMAFGSTSNNTFTATQVAINP